MKKNITINLCGRLFQIDEDAYEMLQHYIESLRSSFGKQEGGDEIVDDIEARIAELFDELKQNGTEAITIDHVKEIITRIGEPEQLADESDDADSSRNGHKYDSFGSAANGMYENLRERTAGKRLYRNPKDKVLAGVLSGIAAYTGTDPTLWRIGFVVLTFLSYPILHLFHMANFLSFNLTWAIIYLILAIAIPEAKSPGQKLQMEGKDVTPQNLADVVVEEKTPQNYSLGRRFLSMLLKILMGIFVAFAVIGGLAMIVCLMLIIVSIVIIFCVPSAEQFDLPFNLGYFNLPEFYISHPWVVVAFIGGLLLLLIIPIYAIIHMLLTRTGKVQPMSIMQRVIWLTLWFFSLCAFIPSMILLADNAKNRYNEEYRRTHTFQGVVMDQGSIDYLRQGGWTLLKAENCAHFTSCGQYYNGDPTVRYLDAWNDNCNEVYQAERKQAVQPGIYRLDCLARSEGHGPCIYAVGDLKHAAATLHLKPIPAYGDKGGELADSIRHQLAAQPVDANKDSNPSDVKKRTKIQINIMGIKYEINNEQNIRVNDARLQEGYGWSVVSIDGIAVTGDTIAYGVSTDETFTSIPCHSRWFSACDFKLTRIGDLPTRSSK